MNFSLGLFLYFKTIKSIIMLNNKGIKLCFPKVIINPKYRKGRKIYNNSTRNKGLSLNKFPKINPNIFPKNK